MTTSYEAGARHYGDYYTAGTTRILNKLGALGLPVVPHKDLYEKLLDRFDGRDWLLACALLSASDPSDWHAISFHKATGLKSYENPICLASDANAALAYCLEVLDIDRVFATEIRPVPDGAEIYRGAELLIQIRRVRFESSPPVARDRVETTLKGIRKYGDQERMIARIKTLPGFSEAQYQLAMSRHNTPDGSLVLPSPRNWARAIRELLESLSIPTKLHQAQEITAAFFAAGSWHQLTRHQDEERCWLAPSGITTAYFDLSQWRFYKTSAESVYAFGLALKGLKQSPVKIMSLGLYGARDSISIGAYSATIAPSEYLETEPLLSCESPTVVAEDERRIGEAAELWARLRSKETVVLTSGDWRQDLLNSDRRLGFAKEQVLQVGDWHLRKREFEEGRFYLYIEKISDGTVQLTVDPFALYKASGRYDAGSMTLTFLADYEREVAATLTNIGQLDLKRLEHFIGDESPAFESFMRSNRS